MINNLKTITSEARSRLITGCVIHFGGILAVNRRRNGSAYYQYTESIHQSSLFIQAQNKRGRQCTVRVFFYAL